jgi:hypothetical protein
MLLDKKVFYHLSSKSFLTGLIMYDQMNFSDLGFLSLLS